MWKTVKGGVAGERGKENRSWRVAAGSGEGVGHLKPLIWLEMWRNDRTAVRWREIAPLAHVCVALWGAANQLYTDTEEVHSWNGG